MDFEAVPLLSGQRDFNLVESSGTGFKKQKMQLPYCFVTIFKKIFVNFCSPCAMILC
jgi:hypothetical protein